MLGTHSAKTTNSKAKQDALCATIIAQLPNHFITSQTTNLTKRFFACPRSAADMKIYRAESELANKGELVPKEHIPPIQDARILKQILIPKNNWKKDGYINVTPLESLGLMREVWKRAIEQKVPHKMHVLQAVPASFSNHGEIMLDQAGKALLLSRGVKRIQNEGERVYKALEIICDVQSLNLASGFICAGHPSITAIGGMVHALERETNQQIQFAIGFTEVHWHRGVRRGTNSFRGTSNAQQVKPTIDFEMTGNAKIVLLLKARNLDAVAKAFKQKISRIAGGSVFNIDMQIIKGTPPTTASYLNNCKEVRLPKYKNDALDFALDLYKNENRKYSINQTGYAFLSNPEMKENSRNPDYPHAWAEPIYTIVKQEPFSNESSWWSRQLVDGGYVTWDSLNQNFKWSHYYE